MGYQKSVSGNETVFDCTPEPKPEGTELMNTAVTVSNIWGLFCFGLVSFILCAWLGGCTLGIAGPRPRMLGQLLGGIVGIVLVVRWYKRKKKRWEASRKNYREPSRFTVSSQGVLINGKTFARNDIHRVLSRNHVLDALGQMTTSTVAVGGDFGSRVSAQSREAGRRMGAAYNNRLAEVSYRVELESGGTAHILASGLTEAGAYAITSDVAKILGLSA